MANTMVLSALLPKFSVFPSIITAILIIIEIASCRKLIRQVYHRILLMLSIWVVLYGIHAFLTTWPVPVGHPGTFGNRGTPETCTYQGFMLQTFGLGTPLYVAALSIFFYFSVCKSYTEEQLRRHIEPWIHGHCIGFPLITAIITLSLNKFHPSGFWCWIGPDPNACEETDTACIDHEIKVASWFRLAFYYMPLWMCMVMATFFMFTIWKSVREVESRSHKLAGRSRSRDVAIRALLYTFTFYLAIIPITITRILEFFDKTNTVLVVLSGLMLPLLGFFVFCVFKRDTYVKLLHAKPHLRWWERFLETLQNRRSNETTVENEDDDEIDNSHHPEGNPENGEYVTGVTVEGSTDDLEHVGA